MTWFRVDDGFASHPKVIALQDRPRWEASLSLWFLGGVYCAQQLTDGVITPAAVKRLGCNVKAAADLVAVGLWDVIDGGWQYHDWTDHQPSRAEVLSQREATAERQRRARDKKAGHAPREPDGNASNDASVTRDTTSDNSVSHTAPTRPDPTRPNNSTVAAAVPTPRLAAAGPPEPAAAAAADRDDLLWFCALAEGLSRGEIEPSTLLRRGPHRDAAEALFVMAERAAKRRSIGTRQLVEAVFSRWLTPERARIRKGWIVALHDDWPAQLLELDDEIQRQAVLAGDVANA